MTHGTVRVSALTGRGIERLVEMIRQRELAGGSVMQLAIPHDQSAALAKLHQVAEVYEQRSSDWATHITAWVPQHAAHQFEEFSSSDLLKRVKVS
jgi:50S ribosomal subunit-associated GTPase HflX